MLSRAWLTQVNFISYFTVITGLPYGNPVGKWVDFSVLLFLFFPMSVKVLPVTPLLSGVSVHRAARIFLGSRG